MPHNTDTQEQEDTHTKEADALWDQSSLKSPKLKKMFLVSFFKTNFQAIKKIV